MHNAINWLLEDWSAGYLLGTIVGAAVMYTFRATLFVKQKQQFLQRQANWEVWHVLETAAKLLTDDEDHDQTVVDVVNGLLNTVEPDGTMPTIDVLREVRAGRAKIGVMS